MWGMGEASQESTQKLVCDTQRYYKAIRPK